MADLKTEMQKVTALRVAMLDEADEESRDGRATMAPIALEELVVEYGTEEAAEMVGYAPASVKQALRRGHVAAPAELAAKAILKVARLQSKMDRIFVVRVPIDKVDGFRAVADALGLQVKQF